MKLKIILAVLSCVLLLGGAVLFMYLIEVEDIRYTGNEYLTEEKLNETYFSGKNDKKILFIALESVLHRKKSDAVKNIRVKFKKLKSIVVTVNEVPAFYEVHDHDDVILLSENGDVLYVSNEPLSYPVVILPGSVSYEISEKIQVEDEEMLQKLVSTLKFAEKEMIRFSSVTTSTEGIVGEYQDVTVVFGDENYLEEKMHVLSLQKEALQGLSGTLYLDNYSPTKEGEKYYFKVQ